MLTRSQAVPVASLNMPADGSLVSGSTSAGKDTPAGAQAGIPQVAVLLVSFNGRQDLLECLHSLFAAADGAAYVLRVVVLDNGSQDDTVQAVATQFPQVHLVSEEQNWGFAAGNNRAWQAAKGRWGRSDWVVLLNQDTVVTPGWLEPLLEVLACSPDVACVQPTLLLHGTPELVNTAGNESHYLGFGFTTREGAPAAELAGEPRAIAYASGAALAVRGDWLEQAGLFTDHFYMYLEDAELGWKQRLAGWRVLHVPASRVWHKYRFNEEFAYYEHLERNRWWLILTCYRWRTLFLLFPALLLMEAGQAYFAVRYGKLRAKLASYAFYWRPRSWWRLLQARFETQHLRRIGDREFLSLSTAQLKIPQQRSWLIDRIANPVFSAYWWLVKAWIRW